MSKVTMKDARERKRPPSPAIDILMDGMNWSPDTLEAIAEILEGVGYRVGDSRRGL